MFADFLQARRAVEDETGERLSDDEVMRALCRGQLAGSAQGGTDCDDDDRDDAGDGRAPHQIALTTCVQCHRVWQDGGGQVIEVAPEVLARARCDAQEIGRVDGDAPERATQTIRPRSGARSCVAIAVVARCQVRLGQTSGLAPHR